MASGMKGSCNRPKTSKHMRVAPKSFKDDPASLSEYQRKKAARMLRKTKKK